MSSERNSDQSPVPAQLGTEPGTQARVPTGNRTGDLLFFRVMPNPLGHTSQGKTIF